MYSIKNPVIAALLVLTVFIIGVAGYLHLEFINENSFTGLMFALCMPGSLLTAFYLKHCFFSGQ